MFDYKYFHSLQKDEISKYCSDVKAYEVILGNYMFIEDSLCRITNIREFQFHHLKNFNLQFYGIDIFTNEQKQNTVFSFTIVTIPNSVQIQEYYLLQISDNGEVIVLLQNGEVKEDLKIEQSQQIIIDLIKVAIENGKNVVITVINTMGKETLTQYKTLD